MAKKITLRNNTATNTGKGAKMAHAEMDANLETFFMSSSLDGTTLYLHSTGSVNVDSIDLSGLGGAGAQGIQGTTGTGIQGLQGLEGSQGIQGTSIQGVQGTTGTGIQGLQGLEGSQGIQGIAGGASSQGIQGPQGLQGTDGTGIQGIQGIAGGASAQGIQGIQGIQGLTGAGAQGIQGIQGPAASGTSGTVIAPFALAHVDTTVNNTGVNISWFNWDPANSSLDFAFTSAQPNADYSIITDSEWLDDHYVQITNKTTTGFTAAFYDSVGGRTPSSATPFNFVLYASDPLVVTGVGAQGITGIQGLTGIGIQGVQGTQGIQGTQGVQGTQGIQGTQGTQGLQGTKGTQGTSGNDGVAEVKFYDHNTRSSTGPGWSVEGRVIAGSTQITTNNSSVTVSFNELGGHNPPLMVGEQVHIVATGWGPGAVAKNVSIQDPTGVTALTVPINNSGDITFKIDTPTDTQVFIMYHIWYTLDELPQ